MHAKAKIDMPRGIAYALASAVLFGLSTPVAKILVGSVSPLMLAGLLYAGSGVGLTLVIAARQSTSRRASAIGMPRGRELAWLATAIVFGGVLAPVALMTGLASTAASSASLLLNLEAVFAALLAWFLFREHFDRRIALGMLAIVAGGVVLAWSPGQGANFSGSVLFIVGACLGWALDNNLTRKASGSDALTIAALTGVIAGSVNLALALLLGQALPGAGVIAAAGVVGLMGYGVSLVLFVLALRHLGSARTGAYFSIAPFVGALVAVLLAGEHVTWQLAAAGVLMALGVWLHVSERHEHEHVHEFLEHTHSHVHDEHHRHAHDEWDGHEPHTHRHVHEPLVHRHPHYPDLHHQHRH
jgi:drug/metabolite transporter (DMT)-like permease